MKDSKLIKILQTLSIDEFKRLGKFVKSDYFNTDKNLILFYSFLKKHYPTFPPEKMTKEKISEALFPESKFSDAKTRNLMSKLVGILEKYLVELEFGQDNIKRRIILSEAFKNRGLHNEHTKEARSIVEDLTNSPYRDEKYYGSIYELQQNLYFNPTQMSKDEMDKTIDAANENLDLYYQIAKLKIEGELEAIRSYYEITDSKSATRNIKNPLSDNILYCLLNNISELYKSGKEEVYSKIKNMLFGNQHLIRDNDQKIILKHLIGHTIRLVKTNENKNKYTMETFELYKFSHDNNLLVFDEKITTTSFLNILAISARVKEIEWGKKFIQENEDKLEEKSRKEIKALGLAYLAFYSSNYSSVLTYVSKIKFSNTLYEINAKSISLKSYFELFISDRSYLNLAVSYSNSFEKYIKRHPNVGKNKSSSIVYFIRLVKRIIHAIEHNEFDKKKRIEFQNVLSSYPSIIERNWLLEKIEK